MISWLIIIVRYDMPKEPDMQKSCIVRTLEHSSVSRFESSIRGPFSAATILHYVFTASGPTATTNPRCGGLKVASGAKTSSYLALGAELNIPLDSCAPYQEINPRFLFSSKTITWTMLNDLLHLLFPCSMQMRANAFGGEKPVWPP